MRLFHFSEEPGITRFRPRRPKPGRGDRPVVWAVCEEKQFMYYTPRDCPRWTIFATPATSAADVERFLDGDRSKRIVVLEQAWFDRCLAAKLWRYEFDPAAFYGSDPIAGYYLSEREERPIAVEAIPDPLRALFRMDVEVRFTADLWDFRERVIASTIGFGGIRFGFAAPPRRPLAYTPA